MRRSKNMKGKEMRNATVFLALALLATGCAAPSTPKPAPTSAGVPTLSNDATSTPTITAIPSDTPEPTPTRTPEPTASPTLPFFFGLPTVTASPSAVGPPVKDFQCTLVSQSIPDGTYFKPREHFDVSWKISNNGTATWFPGNVDFAWFGGDKINITQTVSLQGSVAPGDAVGLDVDLVAPKVQGRYKTLWSLRRGTNYFCRVSLLLYVP